MSNNRVKKEYETIINIFEIEIDTINLITRLTLDKLEKV